MSRKHPPPAWVEKFMQPGKRYRFAEGGRGGGKTSELARLLVQRMESTDGMNVAACRSKQNAIKESLRAEIVAAVHDVGNPAGWEFGQAEMNYHVEGDNPIKSRVFFAGLNAKVSAIYGWSQVNLTWIDEAQFLSREAWNTLYKTVFRRVDSQVWMSLNPWYAEDAVYARMVDRFNPRSDVRVTVNWRDNPYFAELPMAEDRENDHRYAEETGDWDEYNHEWEGQLKKAREGAWLDMDAYDELMAKLPWPEPHVPVWIGGDMGISDDLTALSYTWQEGIFLRQKWRIYAPSRVIDRDGRLSEWERAGFIERCGGNQVDLRAIEDRLLDDDERFSVRRVSLDPHQAVGIAQTLEAWGVPVTQKDQSARSYNGPMMVQTSLMSSGLYQPDANPAARWMYGNVRAAEDRDGRTRPAKPEDAPRMKIDAASAGLTGLMGWLEDNSAASLRERPKETEEAAA